MAEAVVGVCAAMLALGAVLAVRWGGRAYVDVRTADAGAPAGVRFVRRLLLGVMAGVIAGLTVASPGGRLAMRLLAVTAPDRAVGRVTEADEIVGRVSIAGTIGFMIFVGLGFGLASAGLYVVVRRWLPSGRLGGVAFGALLLLVPGIAVDPLRRDNPDFQLVGPGWVALVVFGLLALLHGAVVAGTVARLSEVVPVIRLRGSREWVTWVWHAPLALLALVPFFLVPTAAVGAIVVLLDRTAPAVGRALRSRASILTGRVALALVALVALPFFTVTAGDILTSSP